MKRRVAVLGGGITGVVVAGELSKSNDFEVELFEAAPRLGGLHRSLEFDGAWYDIGTFGFTESHQIFSTFPDAKALCVKTPYRYKSLTPMGTIDGYPLSVRGYVKEYGRMHFCYALADIAFSKLLYSHRKDIPSFAKYYIGGTVYKESGLKNYIERLYSMEDRQIDISFAKKRLAFMEEFGSVRKTLRKLLLRKETVLSGSPFLAKHGIVRPKEGFSKLYDFLGKKLEKRGVVIRTATKLKSISTGKERSFLLEHQAESKEFDHVISSIPIKASAKLVDLELTDNFEYVGLITLFFTFEGKVGFDGEVLHNFTDEGSWKRLTLFSRYYGKHQGQDYLSVEITVSADQKFDIDKEATRFGEHVISHGLFEGALTLKGSTFTRYAYPVYRKSTYESLQKWKTKLSSRGLILAGRQGEFDYVSSGDAAANAQAVAGSLMQQSLS